MTEFRAFSKIPRLNRDMVITEKIDGTNGAIVITPSNLDVFDQDYCSRVRTNEGLFDVYAQSRSRFVNVENDNHGFAQWVCNRSVLLVDTLGEGTHFGEFWGSGIQRGYGLTKGEKRFSLFNTSRWNEENTASVPGLSAVPVLYEGPFNSDTANLLVTDLKAKGSVASPGFMRPEGVIVFHTAANSMFKVTCENDQYHKGAQ